MRVIACLLVITFPLPAQSVPSGVVRAEAFLKADPRPLTDSAIAVLRSAVAVAPSSRAHALLAQAWAINFTRQPRNRAYQDSALAHVDVALRLNPTNAHAFYVRGAALGAAGDREGQIAAYRSAVELEPYHADAPGLLISALWDAGRTREAFALGERYRTDSIANPRALFRHGWNLLRLWEQERGIDLFRRLIGLDPGGVYESWGHGEIAYVHRARGNAAAAIAEMEAAVRARPADQVSNVGLAMMLLNAGQTDRARSILQRELARDSLARGYGQIPAQMLLGWAHMQLGDSAGGIRILDQFASRDSTRMDAVHAIKGEREAALTRLERSGSINVYAGPDSRDMIYASLRRDPRYHALEARSRTRINDRRRELGLPPIADSASMGRLPRSNEH